MISCLQNRSNLEKMQCSQRSLFFHILCYRKVSCLCENFGLVPAQFHLYYVLESNNAAPKLFMPFNTTPISGLYLESRPPPNLGLGWL